MNPDGAPTGPPVLSASHEVHTVTQAYPFYVFLRRALPLRRPHR